MRAVPSALLTVWFVACAVCRAEPSFPYTLTMEKGRVEVRSGPGREYYVTEYLPADSKIEVYRHDGDGWLAIRPTPGSFSLVEKKYLELTDRDRVAKLRHENAPCRVGSRVSQVDKYVTQVRLRQDELVELYQAEGGGNGDADSQWVRIWPPAGEFRWVHKDDVRKADTAGQSSWQPKKDAAADRSEAVRLPPETSRKETADVRTAERTDRPEAAQTEERTSGTPSGPWVSPKRAVTDDVGALELELAMMVSREMRAWRLDALRDRVRATLDRQGDESQRVRARRLLARISAFEDLLDRASEVSESNATAAPMRSASSPTAAQSGDRNTFDGVTYDGTGWLVPVHASTGSVPPYALLDRQGDVLHYISPTPGLNLQRYLRKQIGVFGNRGYIPALNKPHVTAQRVVDLERHLR